MACITGDETGLVKVWDVSKSAGVTLAFSYGEQSRKRGVAGLCWMDSLTREVAFSMEDGVLSVLDVNKRSLLKSEKIGCVAALPNGLSFLSGKLFIVSKDAKIVVANAELRREASFECNRPVDALHIHRKFAMVSIGGRDNNLFVYDLAAQDVATPVFKAQNVSDHVLDVPYPVYVTGTCIVNPFVFCVSTAFHQVRFYDRRSSARPVQEYEISREIDRRPTTLMQWNCNKFLIGEASGDVHLYDTRRGFVSRAKLRGGVGSVRCMTKHPAGHQLLGVAGLDRKARIYHVPTGNLLMTIYAKQKVRGILFDKQLPFADNTGMFSGIANHKQPNKFTTLGDEVWDSMDPVVDDINDEGVLSKMSL